MFLAFRSKMIFLAETPLVISSLRIAHAELSSIGSGALSDITIIELLFFFCSSAPIYALCNVAGLGIEPPGRRSMKSVLLLYGKLLSFFTIMPGRPKNEATMMIVVTTPTEKMRKENSPPVVFSTGFCVIFFCVLSDSFPPRVETLFPSG